MFEKTNVKPKQDFHGAGKGLSTGGPVRIYVAGRVIGQVRGGVFEKVIRGSKHLLRRPLAICLDIQSLDDAEQAGADEVQVTDAETGITYRATVAHIRRFGFGINRGYGDQIALTLPQWTTGERQASQLPLFGGHA